MKKRTLGIILVVVISLTGCTSGNTQQESPEPVSLEVQEQAHEHNIVTESNSDGTHTTKCINNDGLICDYTEKTEECTYGEDWTCTVCGYQTEPVDPYGFEEIDIPVWTRVNTQWGLYAAPDKNSEKVMQTNGIEELRAIGIGIYNDIEWYCIEKDGVVGYLETKKLDTEEPLMTQLEEANESGEITFDENVQYFYGFKEDLITKESIHAGENCPYDMYVLQYDDNGEPFCYAPSTADLGVFSNKSINKIFNSHIGVFTGFGELPYDSTWKDMTVIRVYFDHN